MKNKMMKVLGVVLTLAVLAGLLISAVPVSADNQAWSNLSQPTVTAGSNANVYAISGDGKTMYLYDTGTNLKLYKSTDGGYTWSNSGLDTGTTFLHGKAITKIVISSKDSSELLATEGTNLYRSTNSGQTWTTTGPTGTIRSIAIAESTSGSSAYLVGTDGAVYLYDPDDDNGGDWTAINATAWSGADAVAVAFSPNYASDTAIIALAGAVSGNYTLKTMITYSDVSDTASAFWGNVVSNSDVLTSYTAGVKASLALPSNYDPNSTSACKVFVGLGAGKGVYRVTGKINSSSLSTVKAITTTEYNVNSLAYKGTSSAGTLVIGQADSVNVVSTTDAATGTSSFSFTDSGDTSSSPTGDARAPNVVVKFSGDTLFAGTAGDSSGLAVSTNYYTFAEIAFIHVSALANTHLADKEFADANNWFVVVQDDVNADSFPPTTTPPTMPVTADDIWMLFATTDAGATWKEIRNMGTSELFQIKHTMSYATDKTLYLTQKGANSKKILKSTDAGATWSTITSPGNVSVSELALVDANTYWVGSSAGLRLSTASSAVYLDGETPAVALNFPGMFIVSTSDGSIWLSTDNAATFSRLGDKEIFSVMGAGGPPPTMAVDMMAKTIYAQETTNFNILKWVIGTSTAWETALKNSDLPTALQGASSPSNPGVSQLIVNGEVWTIGSKGNTTSQYWRSVDITDTDNAGFTVIPNCTVAGTGTIKPGPWMPDMTTGASTIKTIVTRNSAPTGEYLDSVMTYTDTLLAAPTIKSPKDGDNLGTPVTFSWNTVSGNSIRYQLEVAYDSSFNSLADISAASANTSGTTIANQTLAEGNTYYWRVRVLSPINSKWSTPVKFTVKTTSVGTANVAGLATEGRIFPSNGATGVGLNTPFTWGPVTNATSYDFKIGTDPSFATVVDKADGLTSTAYTPKGLKVGTTYYWEVRAVNGTVAGDWVVSAFTTGSGTVGTAVPTGAAPQPTTVVTVAPPNVIVTVAPATGTGEAPGTPAYIWVIIVIGAILVIAVIVLIARTRRV